MHSSAHRGLGVDRKGRGRAKEEGNGKINGSESICVVRVVGVTTSRAICSVGEWNIRNMSVVEKRGGRWVGRGNPGVWPIVVKSGRI